jgi:hypothetical protein
MGGLKELPRGPLPRPFLANSASRPALQAQRRRISSNMHKPAGRAARPGSDPRAPILKLEASEPRSFPRSFFPICLPQRAERDFDPPVEVSFCCYWGNSST